MESPFDNNHSSVILYIEPFLNLRFKEYQDIVTFSQIPEGPLQQLVYPISTPKLSIFQSPPPVSTCESCMYVLSRYPNNRNMQLPNSFMGVDDLSNIFSYLRKNNYKIDTESTKVLQRSKIPLNQSNTRSSGKKQMICLVEYQGNA